MKYKTTAAWIDGGICGHMWMPNAMAGKTFRKNMRGPWGIMDHFTEPASFRDALLSLLMAEGGDFQDASFTADTRIVVERVAYEGPSRRKVHVWEREISALPDCDDLVNADHFAGDFFSEE